MVDDKATEWRVNVTVMFLHVERDPQFVDDWNRLPLVVEVLHLGNILLLVRLSHLFQTPQLLFVRSSHQIISGGAPSVAAVVSR